MEPDPGVEAPGSGQAVHCFLRIPDNCEVATFWPPFTDVPFSSFAHSEAERLRQASLESLVRWG